MSWLDPINASSGGAEKRSWPVIRACCGAERRGCASDGSLILSAAANSEVA